MMRHVLYGLFALCFSVASIAATNITVNTTVDEDGANSNACSLREAVKTINQGFGFGGCKLGTVIQLAEGSYVLTRGQLVVKASMTIKGADVIDEEATNPYSGEKALTSRPKSTISADNASRLFYVDQGASLTLQHLVITKGRVTGTSTPVVYSDEKPINALSTSIPSQGGLVFSRGGLVLTNVEASEGEASMGGGAFLLTGENANLTASNAWIHDNKTAQRGGVLLVSGSDCKTNNVLNAHSIDFTNSTVEANTATTGAHGIDFLCGGIDFQASNTTFADNSGGSGSGAVIDWTDANAVSIMTLTNVTMVNNDVGIRSAAIASFAVTNSIILWNDTDCQGVAPVDLTYKGESRNNRFSTDCSTFLNRASVTNDVASNPARVKGADVLTDQLLLMSFVSADPAGLDTALLMPVYVPKAGASSIILNLGDQDTCTTSDARGVLRTSGTVCDIGAAERREPTAIDDEASNAKGDGRVVIADVLKNDLAGEGESPTELKDDYDVVALSCAPEELGTWDNAWGDINDLVSVDAEDQKIHFDGSSITSLPFTVLCDYKISRKELPHDESSPATVTLTINNLAPAPEADAITIGSADPVMIDLLANDEDGDGGEGKDFNQLDVDTVTISSFPEVGKLRCVTPTSTFALIPGLVEVCPGGVVLYTPNSGFTQFGDAFSYTVEDIAGEISEETTVTVTPQDVDSYANGGAAGLWLGGVFTLLWLRRRHVGR